MKVISGGQKGADLGALLGAYKAGVETGGTAPQGYRTEDGPLLDLKLLGLCEDSSSSYGPRTLKNVLESQGTLLIGDMNSKGSKDTLGLCKSNMRPYHIVVYPPIYSEEYLTESIAVWIAENSITCLNVAGNRESVNPGIQKFTGRLVYRILNHMR